MFFEKGLDQLIVTLYTLIYPSLCSQSADPNPFLGTAGITIKRGMEDWWNSSRSTPLPTTKCTFPTSLFSNPFHHFLFDLGPKGQK